MKPNRLISTRSLPCSLLSLLAFAGFAHAQNQTINGDLTVTNGFKTGTTGTGGGMELRLGGLMIAKGTLNSSPVLVSTDEGAGTRLLWHPRKAAFRAGHATGTQWNEANIGSYSTAFGYNSIASGSRSTVVGGGHASGLTSTVIGGGYASGSRSIAMADAEAIGVNSIAFGHESSAYGNYSIAMGQFTYAPGIASTAFGYGANAYGNYSTSIGTSTNASGISSTAMGSGTYADAHSSFTLGIYNIGGGNPTTWVSTDPLFEIGNGTYYNRSNAVTVYKNGNMDVQGAITCAPGGDIPMFGE